MGEYVEKAKTFLQMRSLRNQEGPTAIVIRNVWKPEKFTDFFLKETKEGRLHLKTSKRFLVRRQIQAR